MPSVVLQNVLILQTSFQNSCIVVRFDIDKLNLLKLFCHLFCLLHVVLQNVQQTFCLFWSPESSSAEKENIVCDFRWSRTFCTITGPAEWAERWIILGVFFNQWKSESVAKQLCNWRWLSTTTACVNYFTRCSYPMFYQIFLIMPLFRHN